MSHLPESGDYGSANAGELRAAGMIDGFVDIGRNEFSIMKHPFLLLSPKRICIRQIDQRMAMGIVGRRAYIDHHGRSLINRGVGCLSGLLRGTRPWAFEEEDPKANHSLVTCGGRFHR